MSADSVHSAIERELKMKGDCCDWQDFTSVLENTTVGSSTWQCKIFYNGVMVQTAQQYLGEALNWQARRTQPRGIPSLKRADIIEILCPMMPESRRTFWNNIPSNDTSLDLIDNFV